MSSNNKHCHNCAHGAIGWQEMPCKLCLRTEAGDMLPNWTPAKDAIEKAADELEKIGESYAATLNATKGNMSDAQAATLLRDFGIVPTPAELAAMVAQNERHYEAEQNAKGLRGSNPKKAFGAVKPGLGFMSVVALVTDCFAAELGANKYGAFNWRDEPVDALTYTDAAFRHMALWLCGEDNDDETGVSHLGNIRVDCGIVLDAMATGNLIDNRPKSPAALAELKRLFALKKQQAETKSI